MSEKKNPSRVLISPTFRMSYPTLLAPERFKDPNTGKPKGDPMFNMEMIFDPDDIPKFQIETESDGWVDADPRKIAKELASEKWGPEFNLKEAVKHGGINWPFKNGNDKAEANPAKNGHLEGKVTIRAKALTLIDGKPKPPPRLYFTQDGKLKQLDRSIEPDMNKAQNMFYGGAYCYAELGLSVNEFAGKKNVTFYINGVGFEDKGERLGGGSALERMKGVRGGSTATDPTEGMDDLDDGIPF